jgi:hypothetical protein
LGQQSIGDNLAEDLSLSQLELFRRSAGHAPHRYVLLQRIERAKQGLRDTGHSVLEVGSMPVFRIRAISPARLISLVLLALAVSARYLSRLTGSWR